MEEKLENTAVERRQEVIGDVEGSKPKPFSRVTRKKKTSTLSHTIGHGFEHWYSIPTEFWKPSDSSRSHFKQKWEDHMSPTSEEQESYVRGRRHFEEK